MAKFIPEQAKTEAVNRFPVPHIKKDVKAFLGLSGYYRRFIRGYATIAHALTELTKKNQPDKVQWTEECQKAFDSLKAALISEPVLKAPDFNREFILQTDASLTGIGYVLSQEDATIPLHLPQGAFPRERNYSALEKEGLAIVEGVRHFRVSEYT